MMMMMMMIWATRTIYNRIMDCDPPYLCLCLDLRFTITLARNDYVKCDLKLHNNS